VPGTILASVPDNTQGGAYLTIAFPLLLFCVIAAVLYIVLIGRPHARVPARRIATVADTGPPSPEAAHAAAIAAGLPLAEGGGSVESGAEPAGAVSAALAEADPNAPPADATPPTDDTPPADATGDSE
jgi:hypothetical protein